MSYILDALRKADAQRERDPARGIHAQPLHGAPSPHGPQVRKSAFVWGGTAAGVALLAAGTWYAMRAPAGDAQGTPLVRAPERPAAAAQPAAAATAVATPAQAIVPAAPAFLPAPPPAVAPALVPAVAEDGFSPRQQRAIRTAQASPPVMAASPTASGMPQVAASPLAAAQPPMPLPQTAPVPAPGAPGMVSVPPPGMTPMPAPRPMPFQPGPPARTPVPPAPPTPPVAGLPADAPKLTITGGVYSADKSQRMLIVNGQVAKEGAELGSGVRLDEIQPKAAVLTFRGTRYVVGY